MPIAFLKNDRSNPNFLFKNYACLLAKDTECVPVTIIINNCNSNKLILPVRALVSCSLMLTYSCKKDSINKRTVFSFLFYYTEANSSKLSIAVIS